MGSYESGLTRLYMLYNMQKLYQFGVLKQLIVVQSARFLLIWRAQDTECCITYKIFANWFFSSHTLLYYVQDF
ncbi:hypothetical protein D3C74_371370 [compost metagenome]